jgi:CubicO group peptidase (beta-lactamase class C family)
MRILDVNFTSGQKRRIILVLLAIQLAIPASLGQTFVRVAPEDVGMSSERLERLDAALESYVAEGSLPGGIALVVRRGRVPYLKVFGFLDREAGIPMAEDAIFRIASQSKAIVSVGVMMLQEEGKLLITDQVGKHMPEFLKTNVAQPREGGGYDIVAAKRPITIRDLLTHMSGISYGHGPAEDLWEAAGITGWYFADRDEPIGATIGRLAKLPFDAHPGERYIYGYSTDILGALIERVSGQSLDEFLQSRILGPLNMDDTHFYLPDSKRDRLSVVYSSTATGSIERAPNPGRMVGQGAYVEGPRKSFSGGAGLLSTANDYARFLQMMLNGGELDGVRILSPSTVELMTVDHQGDDVFSDPGAGFGLGFYVLEDLGERGTPGSVGEFGWGGAYHSTYWVDPEEELVVVYFTQLIPARNVDDHEKLRTLVYQAIVE